MGDCGGVWTEAHLFMRQDQGDCPSDADDQAQMNESVELPADGASAGREQIHCQQYQAQPEIKAAPGQELQAVARCGVSGGAHRCGGAVSESSGLGSGTVRGREEPDYLRLCVGDIHY